MPILNTSVFKQIYLPFILFIIAFYLRLDFIGLGPFHPDAVEFIHQSEKTLKTGQLQPYLTGYNFPVLLGAFFIKIHHLLQWGDSTRAINFLSVFFGALCVPAFFLFCKNLFDEYTALFSSLLLLTFPMHWSLSTFGNSQMPALFFILLGLAFVADAHMSFSRKLWLASISLGLAAASRPQDVVFMVIPISYLYLISTAKEGWGFFIAPSQEQWKFLFKLWMMVALIALIIPLPFLIFNRELSFVETFSNLFKAYLTPTPSDSENILPMFEYSMGVLRVDLGAPILIGCIYGIILIWKRSFKIFIFLCAFIIMPFIGYTSVMHKIMPTSRYLLLSLMPFLIIFGYVIAVSAKHQKKFRFFVVIITFIMVQSVFVFRIAPILNHRHKQSTAIELAKWVKEVTEPEAVILSTDSTKFIAYYANRQSFFLPYENDDQYKKRLRELIQKSSVYIFVFDNKYNLEAHQALFERIKDEFRFEPIGVVDFDLWAQATTIPIIVPNHLFKIKFIES